MKLIFLIISIFQVQHAITAITNLTPTTFFYPTSCRGLPEGQLQRDIMQIHVDVERKPFFVKCNHAIDDGGWTVILNRYDGSRNFNCSWHDCVRGFGNINREFFLGLQKLHDITKFNLHELLFFMEDFDGNNKTAKYNAFAIDDENNDYMITVLGNYTGDAGDSFTYHSGYKFSTQDKDNEGQCADARKSPGWFNYCSESNIFGSYLKGEHDNPYGNGMCWYSFRGSLYSLKKLTMLVRPVETELFN